MLGIAVGVAQWITASAPQPILDPTYNLVFGGGNFGPVPGLLVWMAIVVALGAVGLAKTRFGRQVLATGGNRMAADFTGVNTRRIKFQVLVISAVRRPGRHALRGPAGVGTLPVGHRRRAVGDRRGHPRRHQPVRRRGPVVGTLVGALLIGLINNGLVLAGLDTSQQQVVRGVIIILAVALARRK